MPTVRLVRQLLMFKGWVPHRVRFWSVVMMAFFFQCVTGVYTASLTQMVGEMGYLSEDVTMGSYAALIGLNMIFPILFRLKFGFFTRQLWFIASGVVIACSVGMYYIDCPWVMWILCYIAGFAKMLGMFGCISTVQLNFTPTRSFAVFLPIIYLLVWGGVECSGLASAYICYFASWRQMFALTIVLMLIVAAITYYMMKPDHRSGPPVPLKGIDWLGLVLWSSMFMVGTWVFTFGEHYDWWDSIEIWRATWIFLFLLAASLLRSWLAKEPFISLKAFQYPCSWQLLVMLFVFAMVMASYHSLFSTFAGGVLGMDYLSLVKFNYPEIYGFILGAILAYFVKVRWKWSLKQIFFLIFFLAGYHLACIYWMIDPSTSTEMLYIPAFVYGVTLVMIETYATFYLSQDIPFFPYFFTNICIIGFARCGFGSAGAGAVVERLFSWCAAKNFMTSSSAIDGLGFMGRDAISLLSTEALMQAIKETYGYLLLVVLIVLVLILGANFKTEITRLVPNVSTVRMWMQGPRRHSATKPSESGA